MHFFPLCQGFGAKFDPGKSHFLVVCQGRCANFHLCKVAFLRQFMVIPILHNRAASTVPSGAPLQPRRQHHSQRRSASTAPPTPFPAALHFQTAPPAPLPAALRLNRTANTIPSGAPLSNRAASTIPSGAPLQPRRQHRSQRRSASTAPPSPFSAALRFNPAALRSAQSWQLHSA